MNVLESESDKVHKVYFNYLKHKLIKMKIKDSDLY